MPKTPKELREEIGLLVDRYFASAFPQEEFIAGTTLIPVSGKVFDAREVRNLVDAGLDFWLTTGRFAARFKKQFAELTGQTFALLTNSGSSANLLAVSALTSPSLGERALRAGDEVITAAVGFPTTVNPLVQNRLVPVFVDVDMGTYNIDVTQLEAALSPRTRAIMTAHTLGNPFNLEVVSAFAKKHNLWLIEDCCDALGSLYHGKHVGTFGHLATVSFYPAHHITMGEGGCVLTSDPQLEKLVSSFKNWGRDCWCKPGASNTCGKRFQWKLGDLPYGYDHKYIFSHVGYNLKVTDMQAAVGLAQLEKVAGFHAARRKNFAYLTKHLQDLSDVLQLPEATEGSDPSWFGFPIAVREGAPFTRDALVAHLESKMIATRMLFCGNIVRQPAYRDVAHRSIGALPNADRVMNTVFWIGVWPGLTEQMLQFMVETLQDFCRRPQSERKTIPLD